ncbi:hypothetical protein SY27_16850 [Flavobacterium sp. 316]|uniref:hypothetical protein n=1 Tax=Flavobacterium sp. 316 TaxID=1603293 RepID=UPI0005E4A84A|nr:hypothetical protein [Flavobacterium sp. 316]KIX19730.1 hypothetical protein SY27_16850 [Flavobacterium sp. 316]
MTIDFEYIIDNIKYQEFPELINSEIELILDNSDEINKAMQKFVYDNLKLDLSFNISMGQIAKLGLIDLTINLESKYDFPTSNGIETLKTNKLIDDENDNLDFEEILKEQVQNDKTFLKLFLSVKGFTKINWFRENKNEFYEYIKTGIYKPKQENQTAIFELKDICLTNCESIWFGKYFYV